MSPLSFQFIFISFFAFAATTLAKVPANQTFRFVNEGEFGGRIIEYDANYRVIETDVYSFYTFPFRLCFYNTTPDAHIFAIRAGIPRDESLMRWVWDANRNDPVRENAAFTFGGDGNFVLADVDGRVVWQTNTANQGVTENRINSRNKLVSRTSDVDGSDGPYSLVLDRNGFVMYLKYSGQQLIYGGWRVEDFGDIVTFDALPENENATAYELVLTHGQTNQSTTSTDYSRQWPTTSTRNVLYHRNAALSDYVTRECASLVQVQKACWGGAKVVNRRSRYLVGAELRLITTKS
ncbi:hypothetical protein V6N13_049839 [Hibiscus sabdariffa]